MNVKFLATVLVAGSRLYAKGETATLPEPLARQLIAAKVAELVQE